MGFPIWDAASRQEIEDNTLWTRQFRNQLIAPPEDQNNPGRNPGFPPPVRGILLQDIWGGQSGMMQCIERQPQLYSFIIQVGGINIANPNSGSPNTLKFRVKVFGVKPDDTMMELFTTAEVDITAEASQLAPALILAAQAANLPVTRKDVEVNIGNPLVTDKYISRPDQDEIDKDKSPAEIYVGVWHVKFAGTLTQQYKAITAQVIVTQPFLPQRIAELTDVSSYPTYDTMTGDIIPVWDITERSKDYPWKVGSKVACIYFPGIGFGIIHSNFHDMSSKQ